MYRIFSTTTLKLLDNGALVAIGVKPTNHSGTICMFQKSPIGRSVVSWVFIVTNLMVLVVK